MAQIKAKHVGIAGASATCLALCAGVVTNFEGERLKTYRDVIGIPTYCVGETRGAQMGKTYTHAECQGILEARLKEFADGVAGCVAVPMSDDRYAAMISFSYNIGTGAFCKSSVVRLLNEGKGKEACDHMLAYDRAGGRVIVGLKHRREAEHKLCMQG
jgi:lysozyme